MTTRQGDHLETEQKFDVAEDFVLPAIFGRPGREPAGAKRFFLSATYFDTDQLDLLANRITLRRRVGGPDEGWHLKRPVRQDTRQERQVPLADGDAGLVPARLAAEVADLTAGRRLRPVAILDTERTVLRVLGAGGEPLVEIADDRVTATRLGEDGDETLRWREIEVESLSQDPSVPELARQIGRALGEAGARASSSPSKLARVLQRRPMASPDPADS